MSRATTRGLLSVACTLSLACSALAQGGYTKAYVADRIRKVEDGVDEFRDWTKKQGENAKSRAQSAQSSGTTPRRSRANPSNTQARLEQAKNTKNDLEDALYDLDRSTNRLRRKIRRYRQVDGDQSPGGTGGGGRSPHQSSDGSRQLRNSGATLLGRAAKGHQ